MKKNTSGQKWRVFAFNRTSNLPVTGDAANITAKIALDRGTATATTDVNPTEVEDGFYLFDLTAAETNADVLDLFPESSTTNVQVIGTPPTIYTVDNAALATLIASKIFLGAGGGAFAGSGFGRIAGSDVRLHQDDDYAGDFGVTFTITNPLIDFTGASAVLFGAGTTPGDPDLVGTPSIVSAGDGELVAKVEFTKTQTQAVSGQLYYTLKVVLASGRHTVKEGVCMVDPTYVLFS